MNSPTRTGRILLIVALVAIASACGKEEPAPMPMYSEQEQGLVLNESGASHFAQLALDCIHREYPNKLNQVLESEEFLKPPRELHPAFYGCFDWHSSVHGHWMLVKLLKEFPELPEREQIIAGLGESLTADNIAAEVAYFATESSAWERMYGWAWLLQLAHELGVWDDPLGARWAANLEPLTQVIRDRYIEFLPRQDYAIRTGVHPNTAFGIAFAFDYAQSAGDGELATALTDAALRYFRDDKACPLSWEPGGEDFLSPCLEEAALMARLLPTGEFEAWLANFLPDLSKDDALQPVNVSDRSDGKIAHLDGLNLSRAWGLYVISAHIDDDAMKARFRNWASEHLAASLPFVASEHYEGSHWLGSFAVYALTRS
ncbi:MAG: DUF2891 domain-containing protein [Woeseiaceae bacterium]|jgi:hypothetical protein